MPPPHPYSGINIMGGGMSWKAGLDSQNTKLLSLSGYSVDEDVVWGLPSMRNFRIPAQTWCRTVAL